MNATRLNGIVRLMAIFMFFILSGCGVGAGGSGGTSDMIVATVTIVDGNNQTATVGTELPNPLVALIKNSADQPITGQIVNFVVTTGGGAVFAGAALSDSNGMAREHWTLGTVSGVQKVEVRAVDSSGAAVVFATFAATATAGVPQSISISSGNSQTAQQLQQLPSPIKAVVADSYGNPVTGIPVVFSASNGGTATPGTATTDVAGVATASWTLGLAIGAQTLSANVTGVAPISFNATATQGTPSAAVAIAKVSGDSQTVVQHSSFTGISTYSNVLSSSLPQPLVVIVTDALGIPVPSAQVAFSSAAGSGYITPITATTDGTGKASWTGYLHTAGQQKIDAALTGISKVTFDTTVTASSHQYDGKYSCLISIANNPDSPFTIDIINGVIRDPDDFSTFSTTVAKPGALTEADGTITASFRYATAAGYKSISGRLLTDSLQIGSGSGTYLQTDPNFVTVKTGTWACNRL